MGKILRSSRINVQGGSMSAYAIAQSLERREAARAGSVERARERIAERARIGVGTLENIIRMRVKRIDAAVRDRLQALLIRDLETEIARLTHELEVARQSGAHLTSASISEVETHLARARDLLASSASATASAFTNTETGEC